MEHGSEVGITSPKIDIPRQTECLPLIPQQHSPKEDFFSFSLPLRSHTAFLGYISRLVEQCLGVGGSVSQVEESRGRGEPVSKAIGVLELTLLLPVLSTLLTAGLELCR